MKLGGKRATLIYLTIVVLNNAHRTAGSDDETLRDKKHFSLFSVVTFKNEECSSESTFAGGVTHGTCYTSTECSDKKGTKSGNCASGFGVCCILISKTGTSAAIKENRTHIRNPLYPSIETSGAGTSIVYTISKMQDDICQVRLDFENFVIAGPSQTNEGGASDTLMSNCRDTWTTVLTNTGAAAPILCGVMTGEHLYLDIGMASTDTATITLALSNIAGITVANAMRSWSVKTSQIPCWAPYRAPDGCDRYFMQTSGQIISPNFAVGPSSTRGANAINTASDLHGQHIKTCIRRELGMCCTLFQVCTTFQSIELTEAALGGAVLTSDASTISQGWSFGTLNLGNTNDDFTLDANLAAETDLGLVDAACSLDYVEIPDSSVKKNFGAAVQINTRYCGPRFGMAGTVSAAGRMSHSPVYDCTEPFELTYHTDRYTDWGDYATATNIPDLIRGMCMDFRQEAC